MKDNKGDIEKLFRETFEGFESDVDPSVWSNISNQIGGQVPNADASSASSGSSSAVSSSSMTGISAVKIAAIVGAAGLISVGSYFYFGEDDVVNDSVEVFTEEVVVPPVENKSIEAEPSSEKRIVETSDESSPAEQESEEQQAPPVTDNKVEPQVHPEPVTSSGSDNNIAVVKENKASENTEVVVEAKSTESNSENQVTQEESVEVVSNDDFFEASIHASVVSGKQPLEVFFENRGSYSDDVTWKFRDGKESSSESTSHTFEKSGDYWVILEIRNDRGKISKDSLIISVEGKAYIKATNVLTPNGDGMNDKMEVHGDYIKVFSCMIFDRHQNVIYEWNDINEGWDGRDLNGNKVLPGVYFFIIKAKDMDGVELEPVTGTVSLF